MKKHTTYETGKNIFLIKRHKRYLKSSYGKQKEPIIKFLSRCRGQERILPISTNLKEHTTQANHEGKNGR